MYTQHAHTHTHYTYTQTRKPTHTTGTQRTTKVEVATQNKSIKKRSKKRARSSPAKDQEDVKKLRSLPSAQESQPESAEPEPEPQYAEPGLVAMDAIATPDATPAKINATPAKAPGGAGLGGLISGLNMPRALSFNQSSSTPSPKGPSMWSPDTNERQKGEAASPEEDVQEAKEEDTVEAAGFALPLSPATPSAAPAPVPASKIAMPSKLATPSRLRAPSAGGLLSTGPSRRISSSMVSQTPQHMRSSSLAYTLNMSSLSMVELNKKRRQSAPRAGGSDVFSASVRKTEGTPTATALRKPATPKTPGRAVQGQAKATPKTPKTPKTLGTVDRQKRARELMAAAAQEKELKKQAAEEHRKKVAERKAQVQRERSKSVVVGPIAPLPVQEEASDENTPRKGTVTPRARGLAQTAKKAAKARRSVGGAMLAKSARKPFHVRRSLGNVARYNDADDDSAPRWRPVDEF